MRSSHVLFGFLIAAAVASNVMGFLLLGTKTAQATHFRPSVCLTNHLVVWDVCYTTVDGDGLRAFSVYYNDKKVLDDLRIPHVLVDYPTFDISDDFSDGLVHTCWRNDYPTQFVIVCQYDFGTWPNCGSYRYQEEFYFNSDGQIWPRLWIFGPGYNFPHTYRALFRADFDISDTTNNFYRWESGWAVKTVEGKYPDDYNNSGGFKSGYEWLNYDPSTGLAYFVNPRDTDGVSSSEGPSYWATRWNPGETEGQNGYADIYVSSPPENIDNADIVDWYTGYKPNAACNVPASPHLVGPETLVPSIGY